MTGWQPDAACRHRQADTRLVEEKCAGWLVLFGAHSRLFWAFGAPDSRPIPAHIRHSRDALIAHSALHEACALVTNDKRVVGIWEATDVSAVTIATHVDGVALRSLTPSDAESYCALLERNAVYLGPNYAADIAASEAEQAASFAGNPAPPLMFGIVANESLIGRIDLVAVDPPRFGLGYWVSGERTHAGIASAAVAALIDYAHRFLGATDVYAGVSHGNTASERVLERNGFERVSQFDTYDRFHRRMSGQPPPPDDEPSEARG